MAFSASMTFSASPQIWIWLSRSSTLTLSSLSMMRRFWSKEPNTLMTCSILSTSMVLSIMLFLPSRDYSYSRVCAIFSMQWARSVTISRPFASALSTLRSRICPSALSLSRDDRRSAIPSGSGSAPTKLS